MSYWRRRRSFFDEFIEDVMRGFEELFTMLEREAFEIFSRGSGARGPVVYGVRITIGPDGKPIIEEFGNVKRKGIRPIISEEREPLVDVFEEKDKVIVVAELPGVDKDKIDVRIKDSKLIIRASDKDRKYYKEIDLPAEVKPDTARAKYKNGVLEIIIDKRVEEKEKEGGIRVEVE